MRTLLRLGVVVGIFLPVACSSSDSSDSPGVDAGGGGQDAAPIGTDAGPMNEVDTGTDAGVDSSAPPPPGCDEDADSKSASGAACVVDSFAVFVDVAAGNDIDDGTQAKPKKTIASAISAADAHGKRRIYLCGVVPYVENVVLDKTISIFGGYTCGAWKYDGTRARIAPTAAGPVVDVESVTGRVRFSDLELAPVDVKSNKDGSSSIGLFAKKAYLHLTRIVITAGAGASGANGAAGVSDEYKTAGASGNGGAPGHPSVQCNLECQASGFTSGGTGGAWYGSALSATGGKPSYDVFGGYASDGMFPGNKGLDAPGVGSGLPAVHVGAVTDTGWQPSPGSEGPHGMVGQGGGGGGCGNVSLQFCSDNGLEGGGGGCGGCPGLGGKGGGGGGASIAVLLKDTTCTFVDSVLTAGAGGGGGMGGAAGFGKTGGVGAPTTGGGGKGGDGGRGSNGGGGAGGAGGLSVGILWSGTEPFPDSLTLDHTTVGQPGAGGPGGAANPGLAGIAAKMQDASKL